MPIGDKPLSDLMAGFGSEPNDISTKKTGKKDPLGNKSPAELMAVGHEQGRNVKTDDPVNPKTPGAAKVAETFNKTILNPTKPKSKLFSFSMPKFSLPKLGLKDKFNKLLKFNPFPKKENSLEEIAKELNQNESLTLPFQHRDYSLETTATPQEVASYFKDKLDQMAKTLPGVPGVQKKTDEIKKKIGKLNPDKIDGGVEGFGKKIQELIRKETGFEIESPLQSTSHSELESAQYKVLTQVDDYLDDLQFELKDSDPNTEARSNAIEEARDQAVSKSGSSQAESPQEFAKEISDVVNKALEGQGFKKLSIKLD